jgi:glyoxylase-like metal-dependent hydrolase (beta-lactamase superfamily II)
MPYYKTHEVFPGTWRISEALGVGEYLLEGDKKALLIDTGFGFVDLRRTISKITKKTVEVVNSHGHVDHAGGNNQFEKIWIDKDDVFMLDEAWKKSQLDLLINYGKRVNPALNLMLFYFRLQRFRKYNTRVEALPENVVFDLGGRKIGTMRVPGHSPGSVIFLDESTKTVFAGDALNPSVFLFFDEHLKLKSYADRIEAIASLRGFDQFYTSHQAGAIPFSYAGWYADFLRRVDVNKSALTDIPNGNRPVYKYAEQCEVLDGSEAAVCFASDNV